MEDIEYLNVAYFGRMNTHEMTLQDMVGEFPELVDVKDAIKSLTGLSFWDYYKQSGYPRKAAPKLWARLFNEWFNSIRREGILTDKDLTDILGAAFEWDKKVKEEAQSKEAGPRKVLGARLFNKFDFGRFNDTVRIQDADIPQGDGDIRGDIIESVLSMDDACLEVIDKNNPNNVTIFYPKTLEGVLRERVLSYVPEHISADPDYASPEELETEFDSCECTAAYIVWDIQEGEDFIEDSDKALIAEALEEYYRSCIENFRL